MIVIVLKSSHLVALGLFSSGNIIDCTKSVGQIPVVYMVLHTSISTVVAILYHLNMHLNISTGMFTMLSGPSALLFFISFSASNISSVSKSGPWSSAVLPSSPVSTLVSRPCCIILQHTLSICLELPLALLVTCLSYPEWLLFFCHFFVLSCFIFW